MKNYKVKATRSFTDIMENVKRVAGDEFECTKERYEYLVSKNNAVELLYILETEVKPIVEEVETMDELTEVKEEIVEKPKAKRTTKKKSK